MIHIHTVPEVEWEIPEFTIPEGEDREICFTTDIGTATPYEVVVGAREKGASPASSKHLFFSAVSRNGLLYNKTDGRSVSPFQVMIM